MKKKNTKNTKKKNNTKNKTKKQTKTIKKRNEARKYIELINLSVKHLGRDINYNVFNKEDYHLLSYLKQGFKKGYKVLHDKNIIKEIECHSLCMCVSILNDIIASKKFGKLNPLEKLYLFFLSYLRDEDKLTPRELSFKYALRKLNLRLKQATIRFNRYKKEKGETHKETRRSLVNVTKFTDKIETLIKNPEINDTNKFLFRLDVCNHIDCEYLHEYKMGKGENFTKSYKKLCLDLPEIFKGVVWLNLCMIFGKQKKPYGLPVNLDTIYPKIDIRNVVLKGDVLLIPTSSMYKNKDHLNSENKLQEEFKKGSYWIYKGVKNKIDKVSIKELQNKHYVVAMLFFENRGLYNDQYQYDQYQYDSMTDFIENTGPKPILSEVTKTTRNNVLRQAVERDLRETIDNTITQHWVYMHKDKLNEFISQNLE